MPVFDLHELAAGGRAGWQIPFAVLPLMFGVFLSYRLYFRTAAPDEKTVVLAASAGR